MSRSQELEKARILWQAYIRAKQAMLNAGIIRSYKASEADYAEWLVAKILDGNICENKNNQDYDVVAGEKRIQVKSINKAPGNTHGYIVSQKDKVNTGATDYAFVFFCDLMPNSIFLVPASFVINFDKNEIKQKDLINAEKSIKLDIC
jgi:hypothetical protein